MSLSIATPTDEIALVAPIKLSYHLPGYPSDMLVRLDRILLPSIRRFVGDGFSRLLLIARNDELAEIQAWARNVECQMPIEVIDENILLPTLAAHSGWMKQQLLKLEVAFHIPERLYLLLDGDCFFRTEVAATDLITPQGIVSNLRPIHRRQGELLINRWYFATARLFGFDVGKLIADFAPSHVLGVTPNLMLSACVRHLIHYLMQVLTVPTRDDLYAALLAMRRNEEFACAPWTEYTLYWIYLVISGNLDCYRRDDIFKLARREVWTRDLYMAARDEQFATLFDPADGSFFLSLVQSAIPDLAADQIANDLAVQFSHR